MTAQVSLVRPPVIRLTYNALPRYHVKKILLLLQDIDMHN